MYLLEKLRRLGWVLFVIALIGCPNTTAWSEGVTQWVIDLSGLGYGYSSSDADLYLFPDDEGSTISGEVLMVYQMYSMYGFGYGFDGTFTGTVTDQLIEIRVVLEGPNKYYDQSDYCPFLVEGEVDGGGHFSGTWSPESGSQDYCWMMYEDEQSGGDASGHPI